MLRCLKIQNLSVILLGYRTVYLLSSIGESIAPASLFVHVSISRQSETVRSVLCFVFKMFLFLCSTLQVYERFCFISYTTIQI